MKTTEKTQWVLCSERLPESRAEEVLVYAIDERTRSGASCITAGACVNGLWFLRNTEGGMSCPTRFTVKMWQPLPPIPAGMYLKMTLKREKRR